MEELIKILVSSPQLQGLLVTGIGKAVTEMLKKLPNPTDKMHLIIQPLYLLLSGAASLLDAWDKNQLAHLDQATVTNFLNIYATTLAVHFGAKGVKQHVEGDKK